MSMFRSGNDSSDDEGAKDSAKPLKSRQRESGTVEDIENEDISQTDEEGSMFGNILDLPSSEPTQVNGTSSSSQAINIREFPLPNKLPSAFTLPKRLLSDMLNTHNKVNTASSSGSRTSLPGVSLAESQGIPQKMNIVKLEYADISGGSRAKRIRLHIAWASNDITDIFEGLKRKGLRNGPGGTGSSTPAVTQLGSAPPIRGDVASMSGSAITGNGQAADYAYTITMDKVACPTLQEAEHYVALIALHELTTGTPHSLLSRTKGALLGISQPKAAFGTAPARSNEATSMIPGNSSFGPTPAEAATQSKPNAIPPAPEPLLTIDDIPRTTRSLLPEYSTINRLHLPLQYRDLWDELELIRKNWVDHGSKRIWRSLDQALTTATPTTTEVLTENPSQANSSAMPVKPQAARKPVRDLSAEFDPTILEQWQKRKESEAFQRMLVQRDSLPIAQFRKTIVETLRDNQVLVLSGETGCGKSTQLPSFLLEDHLSRGISCKIYVTEPRRISAISLAERVSRELGDEGVTSLGSTSDGGLVGYSIRLESKIGRKTRLAFVTNGIALRMLEAGGSVAEDRGSNTFDEITHIIVDEVHERSIDSDMLMLVLKALIVKRPDLKVVLMSATLESDKISKYFDGCPVLKVPGRTFPVKVGYLEDAVQFTGWNITESSPYAARGQKNRKQLEWTDDNVADDEDEADQADVIDPLKLSASAYSLQTVQTVNLLDPKQIPYDLIIRILETLCLEQKSPYAQAILVFLPGINEIRRLHDALIDHKEFSRTGAFRIYPLHSTLSSESQASVFNLPPRGIRKIVLSTNIAETGVTIPDITCVIDSGKHREMSYDEKRMISRLKETYIARSNAKQRRGRAGRVQEGLAFHLFTKARHDTQMMEHPVPEMLRLSLQDLILRVMILKVRIGNSIADALSKALDPPAPPNIIRAVNSLIEVKALTPTEVITPMGLLLSRLPVDVHLGKFLLHSVIFRCLDTALTIAATLNSKSPFVAPFGHESEADTIKQSFKIDNSDFLTIHNVFAIWRRIYIRNANEARNFCRRNYLSFQSLQQIEELRQQLYSYLVDSNLLASVDRTALNQARLHRGYRVHFVDIDPAYNVNAEDSQLVMATLAAGLWPKFLVADSSTGGLKTITNNQAVSIHPSSVNFRSRPSDFQATYIVYFTLMQSKKLYAWEVGPVADTALFLLCGDNVDAKIWSSSVIIDRKIKYNSDGPIVLSLEYLRIQFLRCINLKLAGKSLSHTDKKWFELGLKCLLKPEEPVGETLNRINLK